MPVPHIVASNASRRSWFAVKNGVLNRTEDWTRVPADAFFLDMEDNVPEHLKQQTRQLLAGLIPGLNCQTPLTLRINHPAADNNEWIKDLEALVHENLSAVFVPKVGL